MYKNTLSIIGTGFALFSMFFGAGNLIFPLTIGQIAGDMTSYAMAGLLVTSIGVPLLGMIAIILCLFNNPKATIILALVLVLVLIGASKIGMVTGEKEPLGEKLHDKLSA